MAAGEKPPSWYLESARALIEDKALWCTRAMEKRKKDGRVQRCAGGAMAAVIFDGLMEWLHQNRQVVRGEPREVLRAACIQAWIIGDGELTEKIGVREVPAWQAAEYLDEAAEIWDLEYWDPPMGRDTRELVMFINDYHGHAEVLALYDVAISLARTDEEGR